MTTTATTPSASHARTVIADAQCEQCGDEHNEHGNLCSRCVHKAHEHLTIPLVELANDTLRSDNACVDLEYGHGSYWCYVKATRNGCWKTHFEAHGTTYERAIAAAIDAVLEDHQLGIETSIEIASRARKAASR